MNHILLLGMPGGGELLIIVLIVLMLFGSKKIPELARLLGRGIREVKNATEDIQSEIREGVREVNSIKDPMSKKSQEDNSTTIADKSNKPDEQTLVEEEENLTSIPRGNSNYNPTPPEDTL